MLQIFSDRPFFSAESYFSFLKIYSLNLLGRSSATFITQATFSRFFLLWNLTQNTSNKGTVLDWTALTVHLQRRSPFNHRNFGFPHLMFVPCIVVVATPSSDEHKHNQMRSYFRLLNVIVKQQPKGRKLFPCFFKC